MRPVFPDYLSVSYDYGTTQGSFCETLMDSSGIFLWPKHALFIIILKKLFMRHIWKESESALFIALDMLQ